MRHRPRRPWWAPWRVYCACGLRSHPCPDSITVEAPSPTDSLRPPGDPARRRNNPPHPDPARSADTNRSSNFPRLTNSPRRREQ